ncbi:MAG: hypothetical protein UY21_C0004G0018 [Microgenomates group bacterium GW2011_GWA1_48_10]|nr:MAG: hypothetical protein UY21_C0004G0018 [Microgenomates group bacterium GW2011_GWA1_48_10]
MQSQTFNISLPAPLVRKADQLAKNQFGTRSNLIRTALLAYIQKQEAWDKIFEWGKQTGKKMGIKSEQDADRIFFEYRHGKKA